MVVAGNMSGDWNRKQCQGRKGAFNNTATALQDHILAQAPKAAHSDNVIGDPTTLSDRRLKEEVTSVSGAQALEVLSQIQGCTHDRPDLDQRRLSLIADEVEEAIDQLAVGNVTGSKWHDGGTTQDPRLLAPGRIADPCSEQHVQT